MAQTSPTLPRRVQILRFLLKYRSAGIFTGLDLSGDPLAIEQVAIEEGRPEEFVRDLEALGPTFIKIGQSLSTRADLVPAQYATAMERMQDDVGPAPFEAIRAVVEAELGAGIHKLFESFDEVPVGAASLAQVHRATLRSGREVAVKVQRPDIIDNLRSDLRLLAGLAATADVATQLGRRMHFADWVVEFHRTLSAELDYRAEAENLERFGEHLARYPELVVPKPVWDYTSSKVLTMDLMKGVKVTGISGLRRTEQKMDHLAQALMRGYLDQMFVHGEIHADPHPGNLLVTNDGHLAIFDLGMVAHVPPRQRERLLKLLLAAVDGRGDQVAEEAIAIGQTLEDFDATKFRRDVGQITARYAAHAQSASEGRLMLDLVRAGNESGVRTPPEMSLLAKTLLNLESVCRVLDPDMNLKAVVEDQLEHVLRQNLRHAMSGTRLASELIEVQGLIRDAPKRVGDLLSVLSENRMQIRVTGLEESHLMENLQKIANRITAGVIIAALILASALMMRVETSTRLFGYPAVALVLFGIAVIFGGMLVLSALFGDRRKKRAPPQ